MLGDVVRQQRTPDKPKISTKLKDAILRNWKGLRVGNIPTLKKQDETWKEFWLYASNTKSWCPRMYAFQALSDEPANEEHSAETLWNFDQGNIYHDLFQKKILPSFGCEFLGSWERLSLCLSNNIFRLDKSKYSLDIDELQMMGFASKEMDDEKRDIVRGWGPVPDGSGWRYVEAKVRIPEYRIVVKFDGILCWKDGKLEIFELKTEKEGQRDYLDPMLGGSARSQHIEQVNLAMLAASIPFARIGYLFKGANSLSTSILEHEISYDAQLVDKLKNIAKKCVEAVRICDEHKDWMNKNGVEWKDGALFEWVDERFERREDCPMKSKGQARYCTMRDQCFPKGYRSKK
jgi:hypothetical protein